VPVASNNSVVKSESLPQSPAFDLMMMITRWVIKRDAVINVQLSPLPKTGQSRLLPSAGGEVFIQKNEFIMPTNVNPEHAR
jgi:hypothetical protein